MYICEKCGEVFEYPKIIGCPTEPDHGEGCPNCGNEYFDDAVQCRICGEWVAESDAKGSCSDIVCLECLKERSEDIDFLLKATERWTAEVEIPDFYTFVLDEDELKKTVTDALHALVMKKLANDKAMSGFKWHDPKNNEIDTGDFMRFYGNEIAEAMVDEYQSEKGGSGDDKRVAASAS